MSRLLDQRRIDALLEIAEGRITKTTEMVRSVMYSEGPRSAPPGFVTLEKPEDVQVFTRYIQRQSEREQRQVVAGDLNQTIAQNPAVQQMAIESGAPDGS